MNIDWAATIVRQAELYQSCCWWLDKYEGRHTSSEHPPLSMESRWFLAFHAYHHQCQKGAPPTSKSPLGTWMARQRKLAREGQLGPNHVLALCYLPGFDP
jgi:hypothetical protein